MTNFIKITSKTGLIKHLEKVCLGALPKTRVKELRADWDKKMKPGKIAGVYKITRCPFLGETINTIDQVRVIEVGSDDYNNFVRKDQIPNEVSQPVAVIAHQLKSLFKLTDKQVIKVLELLRDSKKENGKKTGNKRKKNKTRSDC